MPKQAFPQVREVSVGAASRRDSLIHLHDVHRIPGDVCARQSAKHKPRCTTAAHSHDEAATRSDRCPGLSSDKGGRLSGN